jgi:hypothetical protein
MKTPRKTSPARESRPAPKPKARASEPRDEKPDGDSEAADKPEESGMPDEVFEFVSAIDEYKRRNQRPFPTWSEVLGVLKSLGYRRETRKSA